MIEIIPNWLAQLDTEEIVFLKKFILASGSLKELAKQYGVTYPTVRTRLNKIIEKINVTDKVESDDYIALIKKFIIDERIEFDAGKTLIDEYKKRRTT